MTFAYSLPALDLEDIAMCLDHRGVAVFCAPREKEAFLANFEIGVSANAHDDWEVTSVTMASQELRGDLFRRFAQYIEDTFGNRIAAHVGENLPGVREDAAHETREFEMAGW